jgi:hypothetical protein
VKYAPVDRTYGENVEVTIRCRDVGHGRVFLAAENRAQNGVLELIVLLIPKVEKVMAVLLAGENGG